MTNKQSAHTEMDSIHGHSLFQEVFFFCTVKGVGDLPGTGCIYVETVVDRDSGFAFAKVYSARTAANAADILESRVAPFFERQGVDIKEIRTRKTKEYCGHFPLHPYEAFLASSRIDHLSLETPGHPENFLCERFYRFLLKEFFLPALRSKFQLSLAELQRELDTFVGAYNATQMKLEHDVSSEVYAPANLPVDL